MEHKVYLLLTDTGTLFTKVIKYYTKKPYNHASISFDPNLVNVYSFGRKNAKNPFVGGFVKENIQTGLFKQARCAIYGCNVTAAQVRKINCYIKKIEAQKHLYRYNLLGLFAVILNKPLERENTYFCSQFVATALAESEIIDFTKPLSLITPHDLQKTANFQLVYSGSLKDFVETKTIDSAII
ncbi:hypothetical protein CFK37_04670 [Virgibacillus phasianinus]|uniref:Uncharacterized protein n=1 Tax=Virgibacillus phasianinus TaxID=2017483 RepID=A0A220U0K7_9BACI|nr:hypothetical protein [Virgibacillus phasianinus]ASK61515.1 hypothetical protein CFK37_04670 [Virgibacillus phasianinus]